MQARAVALADDGAIAVGQSVIALGAPAGLELTLSTGIVSALRLDDAGRWSRSRRRRRSRAARAAAAKSGGDGAA